MRAFRGIEAAKPHSQHPGKPSRFNDCFYPVRNFRRGQSRPALCSRHTSGTAQRRVVIADQYRMYGASNAPAKIARAENFDSAESAHDYYCKFKVSFQALL